MTRVRFRYNVGIAIAGVVAAIGALPVATAKWYLSPILLVPAAVAVWGWRAGTDADESGVTVRALLGRRRLPWSRVAGFAPVGRRVRAVLDGGATVSLPAVTPGDLPKLVAASGTELGRPTDADPSASSPGTADPSDDEPGEADPGEHKPCGDDPSGERGGQ